MHTVVDMPEEFIDDKTPDEIAEELEEEEMRALEEEAKRIAEEEAKRRQELLEFAEKTTLADIIDCIEKIKKFLEVQRESKEVLEDIVEVLGYEEGDTANPMLKMLMGRLF